MGASFADGDERLEYEPAKAIAREMDIVGDAIHARAIDRLGREGDPSRCARFFLFPSELKRLSAPLAEFVEGLGQGGASSEHAIFRGFYFVGVPAMAAPGESPGAARSAFAGDFFRSVVLPDRDLARPTALAKRKRGRFELRFALTGLLVTLIVLTPAFASYVSNVATIDSVRAVAENFREGPGGTPGTKGDPIENALDRIQALDAESSSLGVPGWFGPRAARQLREPVLRAYEARLHTWMTVNLRPALEKKLDSIAWGTPLTDAPASPEERTPLGDGYGVARLYATLVDPKGHIGGDSGDEEACRRMVAAPPVR